MQKHYVPLHGAIDNNSSCWDFQVGLLGESTLRGGHFGHFYDMCIMYIFVKHVAFDFGYHFWCGLDIMIFMKLMISILIWKIN
jgi:hypothetical protein